MKPDNREQRVGAFVELIATALRAGEQIKLRAAGTSMLPAIWPGDELTVTPVDDVLPRAGEVALVHDRARLRAHRVVAQIERDGAITLRTRGDALKTNDPAGGELLGKVIARNGRSLPATAAGLRWAMWWAHAARRLSPACVLGVRLRSLAWKLRGAVRALAA